MTPADELWDWAVRVYSVPAVKAACLGLQDRRGADVAVLLWCCWAAANGLRLTESDVAEADAAVVGWRDAAIRPLRAVRDRLMAADPAFERIPADARLAVRQAVLQAELGAERAAFNALADLPLPRASDDPAAKLAAAAVALAAAADAWGVAWQEADRDDLTELLAVAVPEASGEAGAAAAALSGG